MAGHTKVHGSDAASLGTLPYWIGSGAIPSFPRVSSNDHVDVVVVGAGITGLTAAYLLTLEGKSVAVLDRERCAHVDTGHTTAHLTTVMDTRLTELVKSFGRDHAQAAWDAGAAAIDRIAKNVAEDHIACDFARRLGYLHAPYDGWSGGDVDGLREEAELAADLGFDATFLERVPLMETPGVRFEHQARFHPRKYVAGLAQAIVDRGSHIYEHTQVDEFVDQPLAVKANGFTITCDDVVIATHTPLMGTTSLASATLLQSKLALYTSYAVSGHVRHGHLHDGLFWDTADPYCYLRLDPHPDHDVVIFGGEDHKTGQAADPAGCFVRLERKLRSFLPRIDLTHRWSGQVIETNDGLPYIGETAPHQYVATGFSGNGMTFGTAAAMIITDSILGRANPWAQLFDTGRTKIRGGAWDYVKENTDYPYYMIRDRVAPAEGRTLRSVKPGEGKVLELNGQKVAAYRDERGAVTVRSAACTHMGCLVSWNAAGGTWDCPCHGSRFKTDGAVLAGPAESPLAEIERRR